MATAETLEEVKEMALNCGFSHVGALDVDTVRVREEVREACAVNKCHAYDKNWACPPACGTLEECSEKMHKFKKGVLVQTTATLEDSLDYEGMEAAAIEHGKHFVEFSDKIRKLYPNSVLLGAGGCMRCEKCTWPTEPCRFPEKTTSSMEAFGLVVSDVCKDNNLPYYYGPNTLTYTGCVLIE
jgi:predicted metal-binding protein